MKRRMIKRLFFISIMTLFVSAIYAQKRWIPEDLDPAKIILLIGGKPTDDGVELDDFLKDKYPYKFEWSPPDPIFKKDGKYADLELYRYALLPTGSSYSESHASLYDRKTGKYYALYSRSYRSLTKAYIAALKEILKKKEST